MSMELIKIMVKEEKKVIIESIFINCILGICSFFAFYYSRLLFDNPSINVMKLLSLIWIISSIIIPIHNNYSKNKFTEIQFLHKKNLLYFISQFPFEFIESKEFASNYNKFSNKKSVFQEYIGSVSIVSLSCIEIVGFYVILITQLDKIIVTVITGILIIVSLLLILINYKLSNLMYDFWKKYIENTRLYNYYSDVLTKKNYFEEKLLYNFSEFFKNVFSKEFDASLKKNKILGKKRIKLEIFNDIIFTIYIFLFISLLLYSYYKNKISIGFFITLFSYSLSVFDLISKTVFSVTGITHFKAFCKEFTEFISDQKKYEKNNILETNNNIAIKIKNLNFTYPQSKKRVLNNINLTFQKGKKYAIVGDNGSGKTTLIKIIAGLYNVEPQILKCYYEPMVLFQDFNKYPITIRENITFEDSENENDNDNDELNTIIKETGLYTKISKLKEGLNTELTTLKNNGVELSGGEWQRIAISRVLWSDSEIYILDEPTASLDPLQEEKIYKLYYDLLKEKTVIFISHKLGFVKDSDEIIVLDNGCVVEQGCHDKLMNIKNGKYKKMFEEQKSIYG